LGDAWGDAFLGMPIIGSNNPLFGGSKYIFVKIIGISKLIFF
jgi:hypothetical protein